MVRGQGHKRVQFFSLLLCLLLPGFLTTTGCENSGEVCTDGQKMCAGNVVLSCEGGTWGEEQTCTVAETCEQGTCIPREGDFDFVEDEFDFEENDTEDQASEEDQEQDTIDPDEIVSDPEPDEVECLCEGEHSCCDGCLPRAEGLECGSDWFCLERGSCQNGICFEEQPRDCSAAVREPQCQEPFCDEESDLCRAQSIHEGENCDDNQFCTVDEVCEQGECVGEPNSCMEQVTEPQCWLLARPA